MWSELISIVNCNYRFSGGVTHSFTGSAEDCGKLLSFNNMYIGEHTPFASASFCYPAFH